jgi:DHA1 family tetracycline resistance protein-like MFS transporter
VPALLLTVLLSGMGFGLVLPGFPFVAQRLGAPGWLAPVIVGLYALGQFLATPVWGRLSDRFGRKPLLIASLCGAFVGHLTVALAPNLAVLAAGRLLTGLTGGNLPVAMAYAADISAPQDRARVMGRVGAALSLGFILGPLLGGLLGGSDPGGATLLWPGLAAAGVCLVAIAGAARFLRESLAPGQRSRPAAAGAAPGRGAFRTVVARPALARVLLVGFLAYLAMALFETIFPFWAGDRYQWGPREIGFSFTYLALLVVVVQGLLVGRLVAFFGEVRLLTGGLVSYAVGLLVMTQAPAWPVMLVGITFTTVGSALYMTTMNSLVSKQAGDTERGLVLGTFNSASWAGRTLGPPATGALFSFVAHDAPLYAGAVIMVACIVVLQGVVGAPPRRGGR